MNPVSCCNCRHVSIGLYVGVLTAVAVVIAILKISPTTKGIIGGSIAGAHLIGFVICAVKQRKKPTAKPDEKTDAVRWILQHEFRAVGDGYMRAFRFEVEEGKNYTAEVLKILGDPPKNIELEEEMNVSMESSSGQVLVTVKVKVKK